MSVNVSEVIQLVNGVLADPGSSSKDHSAVVEKAMALYKEVEYQVSEENKRLAAEAKVADKPRVAAEQQKVAAAKA